MKRTVFLVAMLIVTGSGCGEAPAGDAVLVVEGRAFGQAPVVGAGDSFDIVNRDGGRHTFSSAEGAWVEVELPAGSETRFMVPDDLAPGTYSFFCAFHPDSMGGRLVVEG